jgi:hypothetical protein
LTGKNRIKQHAAIVKIYLSTRTDKVMTIIKPVSEKPIINPVEYSLVADQKKFKQLDFLMSSCPIFAAG